MQRARARRSLELDLRQAITDGGLETSLPAGGQSRGRQDLIAARRCCAGAHPERGMISPAEFIPIAEDTGLINQLGEWVLRHRLRRGRHLAGPCPRRGQRLAGAVQEPDAGAERGGGARGLPALPPSRLELEITEAVLIRDDEAALAMLHQLRELGVRIALDDFGTGYSSLSYLQRFPFDKIKIDRSFIKDIAGPGASSSIVQAVVNIAAASDMTTTAEGVETEQQRNLLYILGCTEMQGYLFSPAIPAAEVRRLLLSHRGRAMSAA